MGNLFDTLRKAGRGRCKPETFKACFIASQENVRLNIGSGATQIRGFLNVDCRDLLCVDICCDVFDLPQWIPDCRVEAIYAKDFVEHVSWSKAAEMWQLFYRLLRPGGVLDIIAPDMRTLFCDYAAKVPWERLMKCLYGGQTYPGSAHRALYTYPGLATQLTGEGFICKHMPPPSEGPELMHLRGIRQ